MIIFHNFQVTATDGFVSASTTWTLTVLDRPPVAENITDQSSYIDVLWTYTLDHGEFISPDENPLNYSAVIGTFLTLLKSIHND